MDRNVSLKEGEVSHQDAMGIFSASRVAMVLTNPRIEDNPIIYVNRAFERLTGYSAEMALGRNCRFLQGENTQKDRVDRLRSAIEKAEDASVVLRNYRADGEEFFNSLLVSPIFAAQDTTTVVYFLGLQREVPRDYDGEERDKLATLVTEIQHRVKNHLSMIVGLIRLQARKSDASEEFGDISRRVESLQLLYEEMAAARELRNDDKIRLGTYLGRVANAIAHLDGRPGVRMNIDVADLSVEVDSAVRIGLIVSEVLTNTMQHAFADQAGGLVEIRASATDEGGVRVIISDDGVGLPEGTDWPSPDTLGGRIISGLAHGLDATLDINSGAIGTVFTLEVPSAQHR